MRMALWNELFGRQNRIESSTQLRQIFDAFRELISYNNRALESIGDIGDKLSGDYLFDGQYIRTMVHDLGEITYRIIQKLNIITANRHMDLFDSFERIRQRLQDELEGRCTPEKGRWVIPLEEANREISDQVGPKMAMIGEIKSRLQAPVPEGLVISAYACNQLVEENHLEDHLTSLLSEALGSSEAMIQQFSDQSRALIRSASIPRRLKQSLREYLARWGHTQGSPLRLSVRSSAPDEDGHVSFAGQYETRLNVPSQNIFDAYKEVIASLFSASVLKYRRSHGLSEGPLSMAVGCMRMISALAGGVLYTQHPAQPTEPVMLVSATWGQGKMVVEGGEHVDQYVISKVPPHAVLSKRIAEKRIMYTAALDREDLTKETVTPEKQSVPCLSETVLHELARWGLQIERYFRHYQDIEWVLDANGRLYILQCRPLSVRARQRPPRKLLGESLKGYPIMIRDRGTIACRGIGAGPVHILHSRRVPSKIPPGAVLVLRRSTPRFAPLLGQASALLVDIGSPAEHLAAVARENRLPAIVDIGNATKVLTPGMVVTVDAEENIIYEGIVRELLQYQMEDEISYEDTPEFRLLRRLSKLIAPLNLPDPNDKRFAAKNCKSYHDIVRFAHEMVVRELIENLNSQDVLKNMSFFRLRLPVPLDLAVIDIGEGVDSPESTGEILPENIRCVPLRCLLEGLSEPGVWETAPVELDFESFMSSFTRASSAFAPGESGVQTNLAIVTQSYLNLSLYLGYHFNLIESYVSDNRLDNSIYFRFVGGVTEMTRRSRRAQLLCEVLEQFDFNVEIKGDLVIARLWILDRSILEERMRMLGRLIGFTRQLDVALRSEAHRELYRNRFFQSHTMTSEGGQDERDDLDEEGRMAHGKGQDGDGDR